MGMIRRSVLVIVLSLLAMAAIGPTTASAATQCSGGWCYAPSTDMPDITGAYGIVWGGTGNEPIYDYIGGSWTKLPGHDLAQGTPVYVAPFAGNWRWVYTTHLDWCVIDASRLWLRWPA